MADANRTRSFETEQSGAVRVSLFSGLTINKCGLDFERQARDDGFGFIAGIDEVGRGCLAGAVVAAACILDHERPLPKGLNDSKKVTAKRRAEIGEELLSTVVAFAIGQVEAEEIDRINILRATKKAMCQAIAGLSPQADYLLVDAIQLKEISLPQKAIIRGDSISASIAAASIIAKNYRDGLMKEYHNEFPLYGFDQHVGYGTAAHFAALRAHGPCRLHRMTFRGVVG
jgi:ribonuclease HII